jgi:hypothetical protein
MTSPEKPPEKVKVTNLKNCNGIERLTSSLTAEAITFRVYVSRTSRSSRTPRDQRFKKGKVDIVIEMQSTREDEFEPGVRELASGGDRSGYRWGHSGFDATTVAESGPLPFLKACPY